MADQHKSTAPKPFVFVLMPFDEKFNDIYKFGIKGAADDAGGIAQRVDEQIYAEGILEQIFTQINKADVIVADMTGRNPNVFYEVGYAHALDKIVLLLTQSADDIPFDLKHRPHTVYGGQIEKLRKELAPRIVWAIGESRKRGGQAVLERFVVTINGKEAAEGVELSESPIIKGKATSEEIVLPVLVRNGSYESSPEVSHIYLLAARNAPLVPCSYSPSYSSGTMQLSSITTYPLMSKTTTPLDEIDLAEKETSDGLSVQYRLDAKLPMMPPGAVERIDVSMMFPKGVTAASTSFTLRIHTPSRSHNFPFRTEIELSKPTPKKADRETPKEKESG